MDLVSPSEHLCYVRCTYCNTVLAVGVPCKRIMDTVTVKCGHCNNLSFLSPRPMVQPVCPADHQQMCLQGPCNDCRKSQPSPSNSSRSSEQTTSKAPFVVKPPEKKHRLPSAYNRFMKNRGAQISWEEIQRIKAAKPDIPHREAFSMAAKNWAKCDPRCSTVSTSENNVAERSNGLPVNSFDVFKPMEPKD